MFITCVYARPQTSQAINDKFTANRDALAASLAINDDIPAKPENIRVKRHFGFDSDERGGYFNPGYYNPGYFNQGYNPYFNQGYYNQQPFRYGSSEERYGGYGSW